MIDTHCHLNLCDGDPVEVLQRAASQGLSTLVQVSTHPDSYHWGVELKKKHLPLPVHLSAGLYPSEAASGWPEKLQALEKILAADASIVAVGEAGLDFHWDQSYIPAQEAMLHAQVELALAHDKPLILHCRNSFDALLSILEAHRHSSLRGVWHCFDGTAEQAARMVQLGFYLSLSGIITFKSAGTLRAVVEKLPLEHLLIETDSPYLSPAPKRGQKNEPAHVTHVLDGLAQLLGVDRQSLEKKLDDNARRLFALP